ncbi:type II secretion system protein [Actinobacteria bacterium YIM 96077]|uniref:Type II secretion system protein n=1 Tax=Phytoactinopolyspora halophila TaxID=1981511 RepID=A0A329R1L1_9ACTN|nr:type II secretion system F family protein [Phytoactinopolyspora halophila]AYY12213.1 type II secretion system protein [Actinobacteria bacterium YIM 96077]RAW18554.1 type II secretion system protein [Phytoactinopolyspora halophila]
MERLTPGLLLIILLGGLVGGGIVLLVVALRGKEIQPPAPVRKVKLVQRLGRQTMFGIGAGVLILALTQWPVAAIGGGLLVAAWPMLFGGAKAEREAIARLEGLASWTESLRDTIAGAVGLEQAIPATVYAASPSIQPQLRLLADRLRIRVAMPEALQRFADDLDDPSADLIVASLILNSRLRGPGLRQVLGSLADSARAELDMRQRVFAGRASTRRSVQIVAGVSLGFMALLAVFNRDYVEPYAEPVGQLVLIVVFALYGLGFVWMRKLSNIETPDRFLVTSSSPAAEKERA